MSTSEDLQNAFAGESQANRKYLAFAEKAEDEEFGQVAKLFRAAAEAETVHAHNHLFTFGFSNCIHKFGYLLSLEREILRHFIPQNDIACHSERSEEP